MNLRRYITRTLIVFFLSAVGFSALANPITAAAGDACYNQPNNANCNGDNPQTSGCSADAYTVANATVYIKDDISGANDGKVELRYSPHCGTNWSRVTSLLTYGGGGGSGLCPSTPGLRAKVVRQDGLNYMYTLCQANIPNGTIIFSAMVYAPTVCAYAYGAMDPNGPIISNQTRCF